MNKELPEQPVSEPVTSSSKSVQNTTSNSSSPDSQEQEGWLVRNKSLVVAAIGMVLLSIIGFLVYDSWKDHVDDNRIVISGRIEAPETYISSATASRVQSVSVKEGDHVRQGQSIVSLDASSLQTKIKASGSAISAAQNAQSMARGQVEAAQQKIETTRAKSKGFFAKIFTSKKKKQEIADGLKKEMMEAQFMLQQAQVGVAKAQAIKAEASSKLSYFYIKSPIDGIVTIRSVEPGELVAAGQVLLSISDPRAIFMKGYIPEGQISRIKIGQKARLTLDSASKQYLSAHIVAIDSTPSFTPENIYFKDDRVRQVFGLKLSIDNVDSRAKPGMTVEAEVLPQDAGGQK